MAVEEVEVTVQKLTAQTQQQTITNDANAGIDDDSQKDLPPLIFTKRENASGLNDTTFSVSCNDDSILMGCNISKDDQNGNSDGLYSINNKCYAQFGVNNQELELSAQCMINEKNEFKTFSVIKNKNNELINELDGDITDYYKLEKWDELKKNSDNVTCPSGSIMVGCSSFAIYKGGNNVDMSGNTCTVKNNLTNFSNNKKKVRAQAKCIKKNNHNNVYKFVDNVTSKYIDKKIIKGVMNPMESSVKCADDEHLVACGCNSDLSEICYTSDISNNSCIATGTEVQAQAICLKFKKPYKHNVKNIISDIFKNDMNFINQLKGLPGEDASSSVVAELLKDKIAKDLKDDPYFLESIKGEDGTPGTDASNSKIAEFLKNNKSFLDSIKGEDGEDGGSITRSTLFIDISDNQNILDVLSNTDPGVIKSLGGKTYNLLYCNTTNNQNDHLDTCNYENKFKIYTEFEDTHYDLSYVEDISSAICPTNYTMIGCKCIDGNGGLCKDYGAKIDPSNNTCNVVKGIAHATCMKIDISNYSIDTILHSTKRDKKKDNHTIVCESGYKLTSCSCSSFDAGEKKQCLKTSIIDDGKCKIEYESKSNRANGNAICTKIVEKNKIHLYDNKFIDLSGHYEFYCSTSDISNVEINDGICINKYSSNGTVIIENPLITKYSYSDTDSYISTCPVTSIPINCNGTIEDNICTTTSPIEANKVTCMTYEKNITETD